MITKKMTVVATTGTIKPLRRRRSLIEQLSTRTAEYQMTFTSSTTMKTTELKTFTTCSKFREHPPDIQIKNSLETPPSRNPPASITERVSLKTNNLINVFVESLSSSKHRASKPSLSMSKEVSNSIEYQTPLEKPQQKKLERCCHRESRPSNQFIDSGPIMSACDSKRRTKCTAGNKTSLNEKYVIDETVPNIQKPSTKLLRLSRTHRLSHQKHLYETKKSCKSLLPPSIANLLYEFIPAPSIAPLLLPKCNRGVPTKSRRTKFRWLPTLGATSFITLLTLICLETVLLSTMSTCAKTFYMHWNTSNSIFRIDNTDHIIDVNKGNLAFEFDQVHIICPVYEPGTFENETEKYIIYNVSKVEYETCRITNADPRVIAICDKPQKLMFFTITFRPFTPQPGGLEFLPGNDYYFISTSSKDDLYRRIGGRCSTNNMKVVFKVCCASEEKNKTAPPTTAVSGSGSLGNAGLNVRANNGIVDNAGGNVDTVTNVNQVGNSGGHLMNNINPVLMTGVNGGVGGVQLKPINGMGTSINTNIDQFNRIPIQPNVMGGNIAGGSSAVGSSSGGIMLAPGHGGVNMLPPSRGGVSIAQYPGHHHVQTGIRINNVPTQQYYPPHKGSSNGKDIVDVEGDEGDLYSHEVGGGSFHDVGRSVIPINFGGGDTPVFLPPIVDTNHSNIVQSTINWPAWVTNTTTTSNQNQFFTKYTSTKSTNQVSHNSNSSIYTPTHKQPSFGTTTRKNDHHHYDKHPNEVVKNEELTYNSAAASTFKNALSWKQFSAAIPTMITSPIISIGHNNLAGLEDLIGLHIIKFINFSTKFFKFIWYLVASVQSTILLLPVLVIFFNGYLHNYMICRRAPIYIYQKNSHNDHRAAEQTKNTGLVKLESIQTSLLPSIRYHR